MGSVHPGQRPPMSGGKLAAVIAVSVVGGLLLMIGIWYGVYRLTGSGEADRATPTAARPVDVSGMCSAMESYPSKATTIATSTIPPDPALGLVGQARSYRAAATLIDEFCPNRRDEARALRRQALLYDPSGG